uniref:F-box and leucine rich repeat protein 6 n=1 Tax=Stegastes partitus TaxID=144197 RepID=A0A3B5ARI8_9TELE
MDASEAEASAQSDRKEDSAPSGQGADGPKPKKASLKRTRDTKAKKTKKARVSRPAPLGYTVHQGEDMLLVISSSTSQYDGSAWMPKKKGGKKKKKAAKGKLKAKQVKKKKTVRAKPKLENKPVTKEEEDVDLFVAQAEGDQRWSQSLPEEVLISIFQMVVIQEGAVPFLCRVGRVCRLWNAAASSPVLWRKVTVGHCWIAPGRTQLPKTERKIKDTVSWLAAHRSVLLPPTRTLVCVTAGLKLFSDFCPHLRSLKLSYCTGVTAKAFQSLGLHSRSLHSLNLQYSEVQSVGRNKTRHLQMLALSLAKYNKHLLILMFLHISSTYALIIFSCEDYSPIQLLSRQTFRMLNVRPLHKTMRNAADLTAGFPLLEELCIATTSYSYMTDKDLLDILFGSSRLRVLDLRGCSRITPSGLALLPCLELECLFWGQYFSSHIGLSPKKGLHMVTQKWSQTLQQLDIANQLFPEDDLELAMSYLAQATEADTLRSLNLSGTRITPQALRSVVGQMTALDYLNLSSCRYLPRGVKRIYRGQEDIRQLLDKLE